METLMKADIFFFVTTIVVVVIGILFAIVLLLIIGILRNVKDIADTTKQQVHHIVSDIDDVRDDVKAGLVGASKFAKSAFVVSSVKQALSFLMNTIQESRGTKRKTSRKRKRSREYEE